MGAAVAAGCFALALLATPVARRLAWSLGVLDRPGPLKVQREPVAYLGGLAVFVPVAIVLVATHAAWLVPLILAGILGLADDLHARSARLRLAAQVAIGVIAGIVAPAAVTGGGVVTAVLVVVCINAVNLIDGMDLLAAIVVAVAALGFALLGGDARFLAFGLFGALAGFAVFNRPPARIYLGDGGSYLVGTALGLLAACAFDDHARAVWVAVPFLVGLPLFDTGIAIVRRAIAHRPLFRGDRAHVYDQLADRGWSIPRVVAACAAAQIVASGLGVALVHIDFGLAIALASAALAATAAFVWRAGLVELAT